MERRLKAALLAIINDYTTVAAQIHNAKTAPAEQVRLEVVRAALQQVLQHLAQAEYVECIDGKWQIKVIVVTERRLE